MTDEYGNHAKVDDNETNPVFTWASYAAAAEKSIVTWPDLIKFWHYTLQTNII